jgi:hypothetical protein
LFLVVLAFEVKVSHLLGLCLSSIPFSSGYFGDQVSLLAQTSLEYNPPNYASRPSSTIAPNLLVFGDFPPAIDLGVSRTFVCLFVCFALAGLEL